MEKNINKPKQRNALRLFLGKKYFTCKRYALWATQHNKFAKQSNAPLEYMFFEHSTPLLRKLKDVDMVLQHNKIINLKIAAKKINGVCIKPGETFSYWHQIGKPTKRKGYLDGMVLKNGTVQKGIGGGLCQLSNLIYWLTLHTPLTVTERHRHGYDVFPDSNRKQPFGSGATCFYNYGDLVIANNTNADFRLEIVVGETKLHGKWACSEPPCHKYEVYEKEHFINLEYWGGYSRHNTLYRKVYGLNNTLISDEYLVENHAIMMYSPLISEKT